MRCHRQTDAVRCPCASFAAAPGRSVTRTPAKAPARLTTADYSTLSACEQPSRISIAYLGQRSYGSGAGSIHWDGVAQHGLRRGLQVSQAQASASTSQIVPRGAGVRLAVAARPTTSSPGARTCRAPGQMKALGHEDGRSTPKMVRPVAAIVRAPPAESAPGHRGHAPFLGMAATGRRLVIVREPVVAREEQLVHRRPRRAWPPHPVGQGVAQATAGPVAGAKDDGGCEHGAAWL